ncbi:hypothetical protein BJ917_1405 [Pseudomonas sp. WPR_5_2]|nr:hypothetical protein BJ917_1405 [Pseudomonas sp. WPR_5_2]
MKTITSITGQNLPPRIEAFESRTAILTANLIAPDINAEHLDLLQQALLEDLKLHCR